MALIYLVLGSSLFLNHGRNVQGQYKDHCNDLIMYTMLSVMSLLMLVSSHQQKLSHVDHAAFKFVYRIVLALLLFPPSSALPSHRSERVHLLNLHKHIVIRAERQL